MNQSKADPKRLVLAMIQAAGRFPIGCATVTVASLGLLAVARTCFLSTVQTAESAPHYEVLYAGVTGETFLVSTCILSIISGFLSVILIRRPLARRLVVGSIFVAVVSSLGIAWMFHTILWDALWLGMD